MHLGKSRLAAEIFSFGVIGVVGYLVDTGVLLLVIKFLRLGPYAGRGVSFLVAATVTFALNRRFTFRAARAERIGYQWMRFVSANTIGAAANIGVYSWLVSAVPFARANLPFAVAVGSLAGKGVNLTLSRWLVFRDAPETR
jgi:putative flippase GtrA